jgi:hypothetical protein
LQFSDKLKVTDINGINYVLDPIRKKNIILQPEELVRQLLIQWFIQKTVYGRNSLQVEKLITINNLSKRFDIVVYDKKIQPFILIECKAPEIVINQQVFDQISVYNTHIKAPYLIVSNGIATWFAEQDSNNKMYTFYSKIPEWLLST